jgi:hypothetical protein
MAVEANSMGLTEIAAGIMAGWSPSCVAASVTEAEADAIFAAGREAAHALFASAAPPVFEEYDDGQPALDEFGEPIFP